MEVGQVMGRNLDTTAPLSPCRGERGMTQRRCTWTDEIREDTTMEKELAFFMLASPLVGIVIFWWICKWQDRRWKQRFQKQSDEAIKAFDQMLDKIHDKFKKP
jgi:hypothetical protein